MACNENTGYRVWDKKILFLKASRRLQSKSGRVRFLSATKLLLSYRYEDV